MGVTKVMTVVQNVAYFLFTSHLLLLLPEGRADWLLIRSTF
jgi:hypothetical protein